MVKYLALLYLRKYSQAATWYTLFRSLCQAASEPTKVYAWRDFLIRHLPVRAYLLRAKVHDVR